jgi:hypothetical protein
VIVVVPGDEATVKEALATIGNVLFLEGRRQEALARGPRNADLNDLVLTAERQFLWEALQRLQATTHQGRPVLLSSNQAKHLENLGSLRGSVCVGDAAAIEVLRELRAELRQRTRVSQAAEPKLPTEVAA